MSVSVLSPPRTGISISSFSMAITHLTILLLLLWFCTNVEFNKKKKKGQGLVTQSRNWIRLEVGHQSLSVSSNRV